MGCRSTYVRRQNRKSALRWHRRQSSHVRPPKDAGDPALTTHDEDDRNQVAVLHLVLEHRPATLTLDELVKEITGGGGSRAFSDFDGVQRAVSELAGSGLLHRSGEDEMVRPTRTALRFYDLWER